MWFDVRPQRAPDPAFWDVPLWRPRSYPRQSPDAPWAINTDCIESMKTQVILRLSFDHAPSSALTREKEIHPPSPEWRNHNYFEVWLVTHLFRESRNQTKTQKENVPSTWWTKWKETSNVKLWNTQELRRSGSKCNGRRPREKADRLTDRDGL